MNSEANDRETRERMNALSDAMARMIFRQEALEDRIRFLESQKDMASHVEPYAPPPIPQPIPQPVAPPIAEMLTQRLPPSPPQMPPPLPVNAPAAHVPEPQLETKVGLNWINRIAVVTLIFGMAFFFKYAVDNNWVGPVARIALGVASAVVALFFGDRMWRRNQKVFAQGLMGLGISLLYLTFYASFALYSLLPHSAAFALMVVTTIAAGFMGVQYDSQAIAILGMIGGYLTPLMLTTGEDRPWFLFGYLFALNAGGLALARLRKWALTEYLSLAATVLFFTGWFASPSGARNHAVALTFALAFFAQFLFAQSRPIVFVVQLLAAIAAVAVGEHPPQLLYLALTFAVGGLLTAEFRRWSETPAWTLTCFWLSYGFWVAISHSVSIPTVVPIATDAMGTAGLLTVGFGLFFAWPLWWAVVRRRELRGSDEAMLVTNAVAYFLAIMGMLNPIHHEWMGYFAVAMAVVHGAAGSMLRKSNAQGEASQPSALAMGIALCFLTLAIPIQFKGFSVTIAWALQGAALAWLAARYKAPRFNAASWLVFALVIARLAFFDAEVASGPFGLRFVTFTVAAVALWLAAKFTQTGFPAGAPYVAGHVVMLWNLGMETVGWAQRTAQPENVVSVETTSISILIALYAVMLVVLGVATRTAVNRIMGLALLGIVIAKLYLSDVWLLSRLFQITAFLGLGVLLLLVSYLYSRYKPAIERLWKGDAPQ